jgi:CRP/FNR family nitrogen fixation transcriptional regulator
MRYLRESVMFVRVSSDSFGDALDEFGAAGSSVSLDEITCMQGNAIFVEREPAEHVYQVKSGAVRSYKRLSDGRRQIGEFHLEGDIFGLEYGDVHRFTVDDTTVRRQGLQTWRLPTWLS